MKELKYLLGQKIKELRIKRGFSQQQLAELIDIDQRNMSNIECGNTFPTKTLMKIASVLGISLPELFDFNYIPHNETEMKLYIIERLNNLNSDNVKLLYRLIKDMQ